jgi:hypothetical protein
MRLLVHVETKVQISNTTLGGHPMAEVTGHHAPRTPGFVDVENPIQDLPKIEGRTAGATRLSLKSDKALPPY